MFLTYLVEHGDNESRKAQLFFAAAHTSPLFNETVALKTIVTELGVLVKKIKCDALLLQEPLSLHPRI